MPGQLGDEMPVSRTVRLDLAYLGTDFRGFAAQPGVRTVAGVLQDALGRLLGTDQVSPLVVAGRTDAGVHATWQVVSFETSSERLGDLMGETSAGATLDHLANRLNALLAPEVVVNRAAVVPADFNARHSATARRYEYAVRQASAPHPLRAHAEWHVREPLDLAAMNRAAAHFVGEHDFSSFCRAPKTAAHAGAEAAAPSLIRTVRSAKWDGKPAQRPSGATQYTFTIEAKSFCHQMVRSIVGFCVDVGRGKRQAGEVPAVLAARNRQAAGTVAPSHGLTLVEVSYDRGSTTQRRSAEP